MFQVRPTEAGRAPPVVIVLLALRGKQGKNTNGKIVVQPCRLDLKHPSTPVGGVFDYFSSSGVGDI